MLHFQRTSLHVPAVRRRLFSFALLGIAAFSLGGCMEKLAGANCKKVQSDLLLVGSDQACKFAYDHGDMARYVVVVTRQPTYGEASGSGKYLKYVAKPGFRGEDRLTIKVERRGVGHVQWQDLTVRVRVGPHV
jgi:hypothetical protein